MENETTTRFGSKKLNVEIKKNYRFIIKSNKLINFSLFVNINS